MTASDSSVKRDAGDGSPLREDLEILLEPSAEMEVTGSARAFRRLASLIEEVARGGGTRRLAGYWRESGESREAGAGPERGTVLIEEGDGPVRVRADAAERTVRLIGGKRVLYIGAWLKALADRPGRSVRLVWYPGHFYLAERTTPLALRCREAEARG